MNLPERSILSPNQIQTEVDDYVNKINNAIHESAREAGYVSNNTFKPNPTGAHNWVKLGIRKDFGGICRLKTAGQEVVLEGNEKVIQKGLKAVL